MKKLKLILGINLGYRIFMSLLTTLTAFSCGSSKIVGTNQNEINEVIEKPITKATTLVCDFNATITISDDAVCGILITLHNGMKLQPALLPDSINFSFNNGVPVRTSYQILEDVSTDCPEAYAVANITCLVLNFNIPSGKSQDCQDVIDVFAVEWMKNVLNSMDARLVSRFDFKDRPAYKFENNKATVFYDCYGNELCRNQPREKEKCMEILSEMSNEYVILVVNN